VEKGRQVFGIGQYSLGRYIMGGGFNGGQGLQVESEVFEKEKIVGPSESQEDSRHGVIKCGGDDSQVREKATDLESAELSYKAKKLSSPRGIPGAKQAGESRKVIMGGPANWSLVPPY